MALNQKIRLQIVSALDDAGIKATADQLEKLENKVVQAQSSAQGLGKQMSAAFNPMEAVMSVASGNVNGMIKSFVNLGLAIKGVTVSMGTMTGIFGGIMLATTAIRKVIDYFKSAREEAEKTSKAFNDSFAKSAAESIAQMKTDYSDYTSQINDATKAKLRELDATQKLAEAEMRRKMLAEGASEDEIKNAQVLSRLKHEQAKADVSSEGTEKAEAYRKEMLKSARTQMLGIYQRSHAQAADVQKKLDEMRADWEAKEVGYAGIDYAPGEKPTLSEGGKRRVDAKMRKFMLSDEYKKMWEGYDKTVAEANKAAEFVRALEGAELKRKEETKIEEIQKQEEVAKAAADAIAEQRKVEDERHREKMKNLQDEAAAQSSALSAAQSRFEKEFALYKSADKGESHIEAEKQDEAARKQLQKDASRYGGKWRIDELAKLYQNGDEGGVRDTLAKWRKSKSFTPEVEAMVRAAAAQENVTTVEERVAEIANNTKDLATKLDELLSMKGGE